MRQRALVITIGIVALAAGAGGGYRFAMHRVQTQMSAPSPAPAMPTSDANPAAGSAAADGAAGERKPLYWHDPMVPGPKFDKPGKSPFMDMQLVPVYAEEGAAEGKVSISPRTQQNLGVRLVEVREGSMAMGFSAVGAVSVDERTITTVQARVNGYIEKLHVRAQYDPVARGQRLVDIYAPEWLSAQEEYLALKRSTQPDVAALAQAARERLLLLGIADEQLIQIDASGRAQPRVSLFAPQGGIVWELGAREGMAVNPGLVLFRIANLGSVWIHAEVPETDLARVKPGIGVEVRTAAFPDRVFRGKVAALLPDVSATTRTIKARVEVANPGSQLKPGMFANVDFSAAAKRSLTVPIEAVIYTGKRKVVVVAEEGNRFRPVDVETGAEAGEMIEIRKGLQAGQRVVASGQFLIDSEASLKSTLNRLEGAPQADSSAGAPAKHLGRGKVNSVDAAQGRVDLTHGPIPSMKWPSMTMGFRVEDKAQLSALKPGDEVEFELRGEPVGSDYVITRIGRAAAAQVKQK